MATKAKVEDLGKDEQRVLQKMVRDRIIIELKTCTGEGLLFFDTWKALFFFEVLAEMLVVRCRTEMFSLTGLFSVTLSKVITFLAPEGYQCGPGCVAVANLARCNNHFSFLTVTARICMRVHAQICDERLFF